LSIKDYWWSKAIEASQMIGWFPTVILAQWQLETGNFTSSNLQRNNNIAGQTWYKGLPETMKGTARPPNEGGFYIRYDDPVDGYVEFIQQNGRYRGVKDMPDENAQIDAIAAAGWAIDPNYADKLKAILAANTAAGYVLEVEPVLDKGVATTIINTWIKPEWETEFKNGNTKQCDYLHFLAQSLRNAAGITEAE
jgi:hypothetical protein